MSRQRGSRRRRSRERAAAQPDGAQSTGRAEQADTQPTAARPARGRAAPRASRIAVAFALFLGLFLGRVFSDNIAASTLGLIDLVIFAGLAATTALAFRRWARRTIEDRERQRRRRQPGQAAVDPAPRADGGEDNSHQP